ncbi:MAG: hypothetical protein ACI4JB_06180 [Porcipelethomonas sp.]
MRHKSLKSLAAFAMSSALLITSAGCTENTANQEQTASEKTIEKTVSSSGNLSAVDELTQIYDALNYDTAYTDFMESFANVMAGGQISISNFSDTHNTIDEEGYNEFEWFDCEDCYDDSYYEDNFADLSELTITIDDEIFTASGGISVSYEDVVSQLGNTFIYYVLEDVYNNTYFTESIWYED